MSKIYFSSVNTKLKEKYEKFSVAEVENNFEGVYDKESKFQKIEKYKMKILMEHFFFGRGKNENVFFEFLFRRKLANRKKFLL